MITIPKGYMAIPEAKLKEYKKLEAQLAAQTAFIDAYLGQPDQTKVWDEIYRTQRQLKAFVKVIKLYLEGCDADTFDDAMRELWQAKENNSG